MNSCILPLEKNPYIQCYQHHAFPLSILFADNDWALPWFLSRFIQLEFESSTAYLNFFFTSHIGENIFYRECLTKNSIIIQKINLEEFVSKMISIGYYVMTNVDEFFIPERNSYNKYHHRHDILLFGYNKIESYFNLCGYTNKRIYQDTLVKYTDFKKAFLNYDKNQHINFIKINKDSNILFNIKLVYNHLKDYLYSKNSWERLGINSHANSYFGVDACKKVIDYLNSIKNKGNIDIRISRVLQEHKKCMLMRINYMLDNDIIKDFNNLSEEYKKIVDKAIIIHTLFLKYNIIKSDKIKNRIKKHINEMIETEQIILNQLFIRFQTRFSSEIET